MFISTKWYFVSLGQFSSLEKPCFKDTMHITCLPISKHAEGKRDPREERSPTIADYHNAKITLKRAGDRKRLHGGVGNVSHNIAEMIYQTFGNHMKTLTVFVGHDPYLEQLLNLNCF